MTTTTPTGRRGGWLAEQDVRLADLLAVVAETTDPADYPFAAAVERNVLVYDSGRLRTAAPTPAGRQEVQSELARALLDGPGLVVFRAAYADLGVVDRATEAFRAMIADRRAAGGVAGDHFATPGANDRIW